MNELKSQLQLNKQDDSVLVERAQGGDREAFGELVRRHRAKVYGYARSITKEQFTAEDIVQDAMIRAFLNLGQLTDKTRFFPWLQRIIRNQAFTSLKASTRMKEQVFSGLRPFDSQKKGDLDAILNRLSSSFLERRPETDPEDQVMRRELLETIIGMLRCLTPRERQIFESFFFDQLPPEQIAELFQTSSANVYQVISRSRKKLIQEKIRVAVDQFMIERRDLEKMGKVILDQPEALKECGTWTSAAAGLYELVGYTDKKFSLPMVMGLTGHAFRINIIEKDVHIAGPTMYDFGEVLSQGLRNIGFHSRFIWDQQQSDPSPNFHLLDETKKADKARRKRSLSEALPEALELIHHALDGGCAVLTWDLVDAPEFCVIFGYDDEKRLFTVRHPAVGQVEVPYDHLGRGTVEDLFVLAIDRPFEIERATMLRNALATIVDHYHGKKAKEPGCVPGLGAYDAWIRAFRSANIEPIGNAYNVAVVHDARLHAVAFFEEIADGWLEDRQITTLSKEAATLYREVSKPFVELKEMFPFPSGGDPNNKQHAEKAIGLLDQAKLAEQKAVAVLEKMEGDLK